MRKRTLMLTLLALPLLALGGIAAAGGAFDGARPATAKFRDFDTALASGYTLRLPDLIGATCIAQPGHGAMGVHMVNTNLLDGTIEATEPEVLVYEPKHERLRLVAVEYVVFEAAWHGSAPPALFGREFDYVAAPNRYGLPAFYALHAWIWKSNPTGTLEAWNPRVSCDGG